MRVHTAPSPAWRAAPAASHTTWAVIPVTEGPLMSPCFSCSRRKLNKQWQADERKRRGRKLIISQLSFQSAALVISATLVQAASKAPRTRLLARCLCSEPLGTLYEHHWLLPKVQSSLSLAPHSFTISQAVWGATAVRWSGTGLHRGWHPAEGLHRAPGYVFSVVAKPGQSLDKICAIVSALLLLLMLPTFSQWSLPA